MRTQKKGTRSSRFRITTIAIAVASSFAMTPAWAADTAVGSGTGVAYGAGSNAPKAENVAIGKGATISYSVIPTALVMLQATLLLAMVPTSTTMRVRAAVLL